MGNLAWLVVLLAAGPPDGPLEPLGTLRHPSIREASGIVASRRYPGVFWVHNDSGNPPALFAVKGDGSLIRAYSVNALNLDWEDIAVDDQGHLYLGDIGNNEVRLPRRVIYRIDEPDPSKPPNAPLRVTLASYYRFPSGGRFDAEGLFIDGDKAVVAAKTFDRREAELFAIPLAPPAPASNPALPERIGRLPGFTEPATGADLARDGRRLAVCAGDVARVYERIEGGEWRLLAAVRYRPQAIEAICWEGNDLVLASEEREMFRISEKTWQAAKP